MGVDAEDRRDGQTVAAVSVHRVTCEREDRVTICNNITVATLDFHRFVLYEHVR